MKLNLSHTQTEFILKEFDANRDGQISFDEFTEVFRKYGVHADTSGSVYDSRKKIREVRELIKLVEEHMAKTNKTLFNLFTYLFDVNADSFISQTELTAGFNKITNNPLT